MHLSYDQRNARRKLARQAASAALQDHFSGAAATPRRWTFARECLWASLHWIVLFGLLGALIWTAAGESLPLSRPALLWGGGLLVVLSLELGIFQTLAVITKPAITRAKAQLTRQGHA
jgi:hypothetical protein